MTFPVLRCTYSFNGEPESLKFPPEAIFMKFPHATFAGFPKRREVMSVISRHKLTHLRAISKEFVTPRA